MGTWTCFCQMVVMLGTGGTSHHTLCGVLGTGGMSHHTLCGAGRQRRSMLPWLSSCVLRAPGQSALVSRRCLWPLTS